MPDTIAASTFAYQAQSADGRTYSGTLDAPSIEDAARQLQSLQLRVTLIEPAAKPPVSRSAFRADDFLAFNQQLAQLTAGGLPIERSLRLLGKELRDKRGKQAIDEVVTELEKGTPIGTAFGSHRGSFPPLYGKLLDAGVRSNNLSGMLLNLGRHVEMIQRLRSALWRAVTYPLAVLTVLLLVLIFIWFGLMPHLRSLAIGFEFRQSPWGGGYWEVADSTGHVPPPSIFTVLQWISYAIMAAIAGALLLAGFLWMWGRFANGFRTVEPIVLRVPLIGPILRWNLIARWCDALHLGVQAGLDLPGALELARDAVDSSALRNDSQMLAARVASGQPIESNEQLRLLPALVPTAIQLGIEKNDLPDATAVLARMYQEQADVRLAVLPQVLSPLLLIFTAVCVGIAITAALLPLIMMMKSMM